MATNVCGLLSIISQQTVNTSYRGGRNLGNLLVQPFRFKSISMFSPKSLLLLNSVIFSDTPYMTDLD